MRNPRSFSVSIAALALGGANFWLALNNRNADIQASQILFEQREANLRQRELLVGQREAQIAERKADLALQQSKALQDTPKPPKPAESGVFDFISDLSNWILDYFNALDLIQTSAVLNILVIVTILNLVFNIFLIYLGDYYISKLNLKYKYPKLARFIKARQAITKGSLVTYTLILVLVATYGLVLNIAVFVYL